MPAYPRSEEYYQGGQFQPYMGDNSDTLQLMREAKARNLQQKGQIGDLTAESIREPAAQWANTIKELPGAAGKGMEMRRAYDQRGEEAERHRQGSEEHVSRMGAAQRQAEIDRQNMEKQRQDMEFEQQKRDILLRKKGGKGSPVSGQKSFSGGAMPSGYESEEGMSLLERQIANELAQQEVGIESSRAGIAVSRAQAAQIADEKARKQMDDQATINAYYQSKGITPPKAGTTEGNKALAEAMAAGKTKSAEAAAELTYNTQNPQIKAKADELDAKVGSFTRMQAALDAYDNTSNIPGKDAESKALAIKQYNEEAQKLGLPLVGGWGGDVSPTRTGRQMNEGLQRAQQAISADISTIERTQGNAPPSLKSKIEQHKTMIDRKAQAIQQLKFISQQKDAQSKKQVSGMGANPKSRY